MSKLDELIQELCPDGAEYKQLKDLGVFYGGLTGKSKDDFENGNKIFITYKNVYSNPSLDLHPDERVKIGETENQRTLEYGDVIFTGSSETPDECGISSVVTETPQDDLYLNSFCFIFRFNDLNGIYPPFMKHLFRSSSIRKQIGRTANGVTRYNVSKKLMAKISIPIPPLEVQEEIVRLLDDFTAKTAELQTELNKEYEARKKQYEYYRDTLLTKNEQIPRVKLCEIATSLYRGAGIKRDQVTEKGIPCVRYGEIYTTYDTCFSDCVSHTDEKYLASPKYFEHGDILFAITGESVEDIAKSIAYLGHDKCLAGGDIVVMKHKQNPRYLTHVLSTGMARAQKSKGKVKNKVVHSSVPSIEQIEIPLPSLDDQKKYADILDGFYSALNQLQSELPAEIESRQKQYEFYRDKLLTFKELNESEVN